MTEQEEELGTEVPKALVGGVSCQRVISGLSPGAPVWGLGILSGRSGLPGAGGSHSRQTACRFVFV